MKLLSAVRVVTSTGISIVSLQNEGFQTFCVLLNYGAPSWFYGEITEFAKQTDVRKLLLGNAATAFSLSSQFRVCGRTCYKLYSGKHYILREGKRLGGKTVGLQYPVWLLHNIDSNIKKRAQQQMCVCMSLLSATRLSIIRGYTLHQTGYS